VVEPKKRSGEMLPNTTSRQKSKKTVTKIKKGVRVNITWASIYHISSLDQQAKLPMTSGNTYNVYGTVSHGASGKRGWDVQFDVFPLDNNTVKIITREKLVVLEEGEEEPEYDRHLDTAVLDRSSSHRHQLQGARHLKKSS
jgi:hypothetical protein